MRRKRLRVHDPRFVLFSNALVQFALSFLSVLFFSLPSSSWAENWHADLKNTSLPAHFVAVDKERRKFFFVEKNNLLQPTYVFPCMTGQRPGDKQIVNDLKTPEGIYFIQSKIANGLDFKEYGGIAYTLNYPNPVDRLRGKTGYSIWIHSKGFGLVPTKGCVVIGLKEIDTVGPKLTPGTAVILAEEMQLPSELSQSDQAEELRCMMHDWSQAWSQRSPKMFDFYDPEAYSKATENFSAFRANKERIFKTINSIKLYNRDIHVLEGPGYWVTWSEQCYAASNHSTEGIRRLYWQRGADQRFRIVGMEWFPQRTGLLDDYKQGRLVAEAPSFIRDDSTKTLALPPVLLDGQAAQAVPVKQERLLAQNEPPRPVLSMPQNQPEIDWSTDKRLDSSTPKASAKEPAQDSEEQKKKQEDTSARGQTAKDKEAANTDADLQEREELKQAVQRFVKLLASHDPQYVEFFSHNEFNRVPRVPKQRSLRSLLRRLENIANEAWLREYLGQVEISKQAELFATKNELLLMGPQTRTEGNCQIWWKKNAEGKFEIVGFVFTPSPTALSITWLEQISAEITKEVTGWYKAWAQADLDAYMHYYAENAVQQGRRGAQAIRQQKALLWSQNKPVSITFTGLRVLSKEHEVTVDMSQTFEDASGKKDHGIKVLRMQYNGQRWEIIEEGWKPSDVIRR
ncbi:MAG: L,D-transpeptidase family protein [Desulfovibrio sp.]|nr:L,D-transpeptidase family protein [Desulfovibrio sp.]